MNDSKLMMNTTDNSCISKEIEVSSSFEKHIKISPPIIHFNYII